MLLLSCLIIVFDAVSPVKIDTCKRDAKVTDTCCISSKRSERGVRWIRVGKGGESSKRDREGNGNETKTGEEERQMMRREDQTVQTNELTDRINKSPKY